MKFVFREESLSLENSLLLYYTAAGWTDRALWQHLWSDCVQVPGVAWTEEELVKQAFITGEDHTEKGGVKTGIT